MSPTTYADVLAANIRAARSRKGLQQEPLAARMRALGYSAWLRQTVANVEKGRRRLTAEEILGLSFALETSMAALYAPAEDDRIVDLPSGAAVSVTTVRMSASGNWNFSVQWRGDVPVFAEPSPGVPAPPVPVTERDKSLQQPVVAAIVTSDLGVLVGQRHDGKPPWTFIAGEQDAVKDENPADTAVREVKEETGLVVAAGEVIGERVHPKTGRTMIYIAAVPTNGTDYIVGDEDELADVRWVSLAEADELLPGIYEPVREHLVRELGGAGED